MCVQFGTFRQKKKVEAVLKEKEHDEVSKVWREHMYE